MKKLYMLATLLLPVLMSAQVTWNFGTASPGSATPSSGTPVANISSVSDLGSGNSTAVLLSTTSVSSGYTGASGSYNAGAIAAGGTLNTATGGSAYFQFTITPAAGYSVFLTRIDFGTRSTGSGPTAYDIRTDQDSYASSIASGSIAANSTWTLKSNTLSYTGPAGIAVTFRIYGSGGTGNSSSVNWRIDDLAVTATATSSGGGSTPTITADGSGLTPFSTTTGSASAAQTFTAGGSNLTGDISISFPSKYELSKDAGSTYLASPVTLTQTGGNVPSTSLKLRLSASAAPGSANGNLVLSSTGASSQTIVVTGNVSSVATVDPPASFSANTVSVSAIDLTATANAGGNNILVATNGAATFGTPSGALSPGNTITGGGTVLYNGPASGFPFHHTGLTATTTYYYQAWSVDASNTYSSALTANAATQAPAAANVVINQVYGGGGNSGAYYKNDFIELYNNENHPVDLSGWSVQYTNTTGTNWSATVLSGTIPAHSFFLVQEAAGSNTGAAALPAPDVTGSLALGATGGKVILLNSVTPVTGNANPTQYVIDKVGFGSANAYEGTGPAPTTDNTTSVTRITDGLDNNDNKTDFALTSPLPRNSSYTVTPPRVSSLTPPNGFTGISATTRPVIVFDKPIVKATGTISMYQDGSLLSATDINDASVVLSNGNTLTINTTLAAGKSYAIQISAGSVTDKYSNAFAGITSNTGWAFTTYNSAAAATLPVSFNFQQCSGNGLLPDGFTQYSTTGAQVWDCTSFGRDPAAPAGTTAYPNAVQINGYANGVNNLNQDWLISPRFDLTGTTFPLLSFWSRNAYDGDPLVLKVSTNYSGSGDPALATWTDLNGKFPSKGSDTWMQSGGINLSAFKQSSVYFAFVYTSTTDNGSRWTVDDISLINSSTPPPPSLTLSTNNLEFGYTATGGSSTRPLTVTGNDLTGDITLTATGNFQVSADGTSYAGSIVIPQAVANNNPQTVYVRFSPATNNIQYIESLSVAISDTTAVVGVKGNSIDPASTLNLVNWNLNWFATPEPTLGPTDKSLQQNNVATVLKSIPGDLFVLQEVVNQHALDSIVGTMPGYAYVVGNYGSYSNPNEPTASPLTQVQKLAFVYNTAKFSNLHTDSLLTLGVTTSADLSNPYYNAFASGRFPYMLTADVTLSDNKGGYITHQMRFINLHAKANTAPVVTSYNRRLAGARALDSLIKVKYGNDNVVILGDFNDDLNQTITAGINPPVSSYSPFTIDDAALYIFPTKPLSPAGQHSDVNYTSVIDNVIASAAASKYYLPQSATVLSDVANLVSKYGTTTTDHFPVFSQFSFSTQAALPVKLLNLKAARQNSGVLVSWSTSQELNSSHFDVQRSSDGVNFETLGAVLAKGNSSVTVNYDFADKQPRSGMNYYRLKQVDRDGKFVISPVVTVNFTAGAVVAFSPNPAHGYLNINLSNQHAPLQMMLVDLTGRVVLQQQLAQGGTSYHISLSGVSRGLYTVKLVGTDLSSTQKLVIQ